MLQHGEIGGPARRQAPTLALPERHPGAADSQRNQRLHAREAFLRSDDGASAHVAPGDDGGERDPWIGWLVVGRDTGRDSVASQAAMRQQLIGGAPERLTVQTRPTACDAAYMWLARFLAVDLVTLDKRLEWAWSRLARGGSRSR